MLGKTRPVQHEVKVTVRLKRMPLMRVLYAQLQIIANNIIMRPVLKISERFKNRNEERTDDDELCVCVNHFCTAPCVMDRLLPITSSQGAYQRSSQETK